VLRVRSGLRRLGQFIATVPAASSLFGVSAAEGRRLVRELVARGLLEGATEPGSYRRTLRGNAFAQASAAAPLRRATVDRKLAELVERMVRVNDSDEYLVGIDEAVVFGSYLTGAERLGDLDVTIRIYRKEPDPQRFEALCDVQRRASGRHFSNYTNWLAWPEHKVLLFLKQRSRVFSLSLNDPILRDASIARRAIFRRRTPTAFALDVINRSPAPAAQRSGRAR
jgi:hypothetical protein